MLAVEVIALEKSYGRLFGTPHPALRGVDLSVPVGAAFGLIGPNGAGKTTLIKTLLGIVRPTAGTVRVLGGDPSEPKIRARIGYLPERLHLPASFTPVQFLASVARLKGLTGFAPEIERLLERAGLASARARRIGGFSKGMRQRLGLAAALLGSPELLILDEPTDGIDPVGRAEVRRLLVEETARGATLFLNSHLLAETERVCGSVGILADGRLIREGSLEELRRQKARWKVRFAPPVGLAALTAMGFVPDGTSSAFLFEAEDVRALNAALDQARAAGALLVELAPDQHDLEQVLVDSLKVAS